MDTHYEKWFMMMKAICSSDDTGEVGHGRRRPCGFRGGGPSRRNHEGGAQAPHRAVERDAAHPAPRSRTRRITVSSPQPGGDVDKRRHTAAAIRRAHRPPYWRGE